MSKIQAGGTVSGTGTITRKDGTVDHFTISSDPLTAEQAEALDQSSRKVGERTIKQQITGTGAAQAGPASSNPTA